jgi:uncharacterized protein involved in exopolysaccharide biosynthesis
MRDSVGQQRLMARVLRRPLSTLLVAAATLAVAGTLSLTTTPEYEARALILVPAALSPSGDDATSSAEDPLSLTAELRILQSRGVARLALEALGVPTVLPELGEAPGAVASDRALQAFRERLRIAHERDSELIEVAFRHPDPELAAGVVGRILEAHAARRVEAVASDDSLASLERRVGELRAAAESAADRLRAFELQHLDHEEDLRKDREQLDADLRDARSRVAGLRKQVAYLNDQLAGSGSAGAPSSRTLDEARSRLHELELEEQELLARYRETSRRVMDVRTQIALVRDFIRREEARPSPDSLFLDVRGQLIGAEAELRFQEARQADLEGQLAALDEELIAVPEVEKRRQALQRERTASETAHVDAASRLDEARRESEARRQRLGRVVVLEPPLPPLEPVHPRHGLNLALGGGLGVLLGLGQAVARGRLRQPAAAIDRARRPRAVGP